MVKVNEFLSTSVTLHLYWIVFIAILYIVIHAYRNNRVFKALDIYLNYIPVLTHEFGHIIFNKISGGRANDLVIVVSPSERTETSQQGFAVTQSRNRIGEAVTTFGGYVMPPIMMYLGFLAIEYQYSSLFILAYLIIFVYFLMLTSRKLLPLLIVVILVGSLYFLFQGENQFMMNDIVNIAHNFILGVLLGEVLQSSWTIIKLTFSKDKVEWDGSALRKLTFLPMTIYSLIWIGINLFTIYQLFVKSLH
ncbi:M50 family metallopeptidase [Staphylococcus equorum]|uniref:M50 family peptidase n=1 Tax=Staphylococcus equorum TaxID=246432 RepID=A0AAP7LUX0_9STAP|nr:M50 family metallopeptidase [Staphylococcus equorum]OEK58953.1 hypothetical protein ASS94_01100 [Staphylococcus equorum]